MFWELLLDKASLRTFWRAQDFVIWLFLRSTNWLLVVFSSVYELCIWSFSPTVLGFHDIPSFQFSLFFCQMICFISCLVWLFHLWTGMWTRKPPLFPLLIFSSMFSGTHCQLTPHRDDQKSSDRCQSGGTLTTHSFGEGIPVREITVFFPVPRASSTRSQHVSALCFILFLGRNHCLCVSPFSTNAPKSWPAFSIAVVHDELCKVFACFIIFIFLLLVEHLLAYL